MLKKSLFIGTFFLLFIGLSDYGFGCHRDVPHGPHTCPEPDPPAPNGGGDAEYSVDISGAVGGHSGLPWTLGRGGKAIDGNRLDVGELTDLSFFTAPIVGMPPTLPNLGGPFSGERGVNCFGEDLAGADFYPQAGIGRGRGGRADTSFWFMGLTEQGLPEVLYALFGFGQFKNPDPDSDLDPDWPPRLVGESTLLEITDWVLTVESEGDIVNNLSCIGEGKFADYYGGAQPAMNILVTRTN